MNIAFVSSDWGRTAAGTEPSPGGAGWVRIHQPALALAQYGEHRTVIGHGIGGRADGRLIPLDFHSQPLMLDPDLIVVQRWMNAEAPQAITDARGQWLPDFTWSAIRIDSVGGFEPPSSSGAM